jgi:hypothetical protein
MHAGAVKRVTNADEPPGRRSFRFPAGPVPAPSPLRREQLPEHRPKPAEDDVEAPRRVQAILYDALPRGEPALYPRIG